ncbi:unnamed protein product [Ectocarpus fasciculatus]
MPAHTKPVIDGVNPWSDHSVMITVDNCGNCFQSSWFVALMLWAVQRPRRVEELISKLLQGYDQGGALVHVPSRYQVCTAFLLFSTSHVRNYHVSSPLAPPQTTDRASRACVLHCTTTPSSPPRGTPPPPPALQDYVDAVFHLLMVTKKCWGFYTSINKGDEGHDEFGIKQAVHIVQMLKRAPVSADRDSNNDLSQLRLKRGIAIVARSFDVWWANRNGYPDMGAVSTLHRSMDFYVGLELTLARSASEAVGDHPHSPSTLPTYVPQDTMRPACSLGYIVGMAMEDMDNDGRANRTDLTDVFTSIATEAAQAQGRRHHTNIAGILVWKASCPHYNVLIQPGALANALASKFGLDLSEGDAIASAELRNGSRWQQENAMGIEGAIDPEERAQLYQQQREVTKAAASNPQETDAAAAPASSPSSFAASNLNNEQWPQPGKGSGDQAPPMNNNNRGRRRRGG